MLFCGNPKDYLLVDFERRALEKKFRTILSLPAEDAIERFKIKKAPHWDFAKAQSQLSGDPSSSVKPVLFRPFDVRYIYYEKAMIERGDHRYDLMRHMFDSNLALITVRRIEDGVRRTPFFRPRSAENKMAFRGPLSFLFLFVCRSFRASKPFGKERTSHAWHRPSSLSLFLGFSTLPPQAV